MAEQERLTKAERRELKREKRLEEERAAAAQASRDRRRNMTYAVSLFVVVGLLIWLAVGNLSANLDDAITLTRGEAEDAQAAANCEVLEDPLVTDEDTAVLGLNAREHLEPATAPSADQLYVKGRPTTSGPHFTNPLPIVNGVRDEAVDERGSTHNLEHGSIIVWIDRDQVPQEDVDDIADWVTLLNENGFAENSGRAGMMASYVGESGIDSGEALAIRGWGVGMDCGTWDRDWANGFTIEHFGSRGTAPEQFMQFPDEVLAYVDGDGGAVEEPTDGDADQEPTDGDAGEEPTDGDAGEEPTEATEPTDAES